MLIITKEGIKAFEKKFNTKKIQGNTETTHLVFKLVDETEVNKIIWACRDKKVDYFLQHNCFTLSQEALYQLLPSANFEEIRAWKSKDAITPCCKMDQQRLSNCVGYSEMMLVLGKMSQKNANNYMEKLAESIIPELEERFNGEVLDYIPYYEFEKSLYKEYKQKLKENKQKQ